MSRKSTLPVWLACRSLKTWDWFLNLEPCGGTGCRYAPASETGCYTVIALFTTALQKPKIQALWTWALEIKQTHSMPKLRCSQQNTCASFPEGQGNMSIKEQYPQRINATLLACQGSCAAELRGMKWARKNNFNRWKSTNISEESRQYTPPWGPKRASKTDSQHLDNDHQLYSLCSDSLESNSGLESREKFECTIDIWYHL